MGYSQVETWSLVHILRQRKEAKSCQGTRPKKGEQLKANEVTAQVESPQRRDRSCLPEGRPREPTHDVAEDSCGKRGAHLGEGKSHTTGP